MHFVQDSKQYEKIWFSISVVVVLSSVIFTTLRAFSLSITHDEAITYLHHASGSFLDIINFNNSYPSNNHLLNSLLIKIAVGFGGLSEATVRLPALLGHILYLIGAWKITRHLFKNYLTSVGLILLCWNPFLLDLFSCGRGYSLGLGFLLLGLYYLFKYFQKDEGGKSQKRKIGIQSLGLFSFSVLSNLVFLNVYLAVVLILALYEIKSFQKILAEENKYFKSLFLSISNMLFTVGISAVFLGSVYLKPVIKLIELKELYYGGTEGFWKDTVTSLITVVMYGKSYATAEVFFIIKGFIVLMMLVVAIFLISRWIKKKTINHVESALAIVFTLLVLCAIIIISQWMMLKTRFVIGRTAIFFLPLFLLLIVIWWQICSDHCQRVLKWSGHVMGLCIVVAMIAHMAQCLNVQYYYEWEYDASTKEAMEYLIERESGKELPPLSKTLGVNWIFEPSANFYKEMLGIDWLKPVHRLAADFKHDYYYFVSEDSRVFDANSAKYDSYLYLKHNLKIIEEFSLSNTYLAVPK